MEVQRSLEKKYLKGVSWAQIESVISETNFFMRIWNILRHLLNWGWPNIKNVYFSYIVFVQVYIRCSFLLIFILRLPSIRNYVFIKIDVQRSLQKKYLKG